MKLSVLGVIVGVYWYCCCFQSSICEEQSLLVSTWIQPFVSLPEEGTGTRQALWFAFGLGPVWLWPHSKLVIVSPRSTSLSLSSPLSFFSLLPLSVPCSLQTQLHFFMHCSDFTLFFILLLCCSLCPVFLSFSFLFPSSPSLYFSLFPCSLPSFFSILSSFVIVSYYYLALWLLSLSLLNTDKQQCSMGQEGNEVLKRWLYVWLWRHKSVYTWSHSVNPPTVNLTVKG